MIRKETDISIERSGSFDESTFGIDKEDVSLILEIVRNKLYTNKIGSFVREIMSNAYDAMQEAKTLKKEPIIITLPTEDNNYIFSIRDYGTGIDEEKVKRIYTKVGKSTRSESNKFIGMMGIGRLVGFCLNDSFNLTCFVNGIKTEYLCYIDETKCGKVAVLSRSDTTEKNGVEISVNIDRDLVEEVKRELDLFLLYIDDQILYSYSNPMPPGMNNTLPGINDILISGTNWKKYKNGNGRRNNGDCYIKMGIVKYPLNFNLINQKFVNRFLVNHYECGGDLVIEMPIGAVDVSASREALEYTPNTLGALNTKLKDICIEAKAKILQEVTSRPTFIEAYNKFAAYKEIWDNLYNTKREDIKYVNKTTNTTVSISSLYDKSFKTIQYTYKKEYKSDTSGTVVEEVCLDPNGNPILKEIDAKCSSDFEIAEFTMRNERRESNKRFTFYSDHLTFYRIVEPDDIKSMPDIARCRTLFKTYNTCRVLNITKRAQKHFLDVYGVDIIEGLTDFNTIEETIIKRIKNCSAEKRVFTEYTIHASDDDTIIVSDAKTHLDISTLDNMKGIWASTFYNGIKYIHDNTSENDLRCIKIDTIFSIIKRIIKKGVVNAPISLYVVDPNTGNQLHKKYLKTPTSCNLVPLYTWLPKYMSDIIPAKITEIKYNSYYDDEVSKIIKHSDKAIKSDKIKNFLGLIKENLQVSLEQRDINGIYDDFVYLENSYKLANQSKIDVSLELYKQYDILSKKYPLLPVMNITHLSSIRDFFGSIDHYDEYIFAIDKLKG